MDVRSIIKEATSRINLVPRKQAVPGDILETAYQLLKGIVSKYNYDNLLNFTQNSVIVPNTEVTHIYDETDFAKGKNNMYFEVTAGVYNYTPTSEDFENNVWAMAKDDQNTVFIVYSPSTGIYDWRAQIIHDHMLPRIQEMEKYLAMYHICVRDVAKINSVYLITPTAEPYKLHKELEFVPANKFDSYLNGAPVYTVTEKSEGEWIMRIKPGIALLDRRLKINYNESIEFDIDSDLYIPDNYTELLIVALAHKLALQFPRLDETQMNRLEQEVRILVDNVRTPKAITRSIIRNDYFEDAYHTTTPTELLTGYWF